MVLSGGVTQSAGVTVPVQTNAIELPVQGGSNYVTYAPEQNNVAYSYANNPMSFAGLPGLPADTNTAGTILIGRNRYPANSVVANNSGLVPPPAPIPVTAAQAAKLGITGPVASGYTGPAPSASGLQAQAPKMDYGVSENEWGAVKDGLTGAGMMRLGAGGGQLPSQFAGPDIYGQAGIPNQYQKQPQAPNYQQAMNHPMVNGPDDNRWLQNQPNIMDYMPKPDPISGGLKGIVQKLQRATPQWQRNNGAAAVFGKDVWEKKQAAYNMLAQQIIPAQAGMIREQMSQEGQNYRNDANNFSAGALATLNHMLAMKAKQTMDYGQAYKAAADAFAMPSEVPGPDGRMIPNMMKVQALQQAAPIMGWSGQDVYNLSRTQNPEDANKLQSQAIKIQTEAFALKRSQDMLQYELQQMAATTRNTNANAAGQEFTNGMNRSIEKGLRAGALAEAMDKVTNHFVHQQMSKAQIESANQGARKAYFDAQKSRMEAAGVPLAAAAKIVEVQQKLLYAASVVGDNTPAGMEMTKLAGEMRDNAFGAMGIMSEARPVMQAGPSPGDPMVPQIGPDGRPLMMNRPRQNVSPAAAQMGGMVNQGMANGQYYR